MSIPYNQLFPRLAHFKRPLHYSSHSSFPEVTALAVTLSVVCVIQAFLHALMDMLSYFLNESLCRLMDIGKFEKLKHSESGVACT